MDFADCYHLDVPQSIHAISVVHERTPYYESRATSFKKTKTRLVLSNLSGSQKEQAGGASFSHHLRYLYACTCCSVYVSHQ